MSFGQRAGRDLGMRRSRREKRDEKEKKKIPRSCRSTPFADVAPDSRLAEDQNVLRLSASTQGLRARFFENNTGGECADFEARRCVYSEKSEADCSGLVRGVVNEFSDD